MAEKRRTTCNYCKAKKVKCSGPMLEQRGKCKQCTRNSVECRFDVKRKTGPKPKTWDAEKTPPSSLPSAPRPLASPEVVAPATPPAAVCPTTIPAVVASPNDAALRRGGAGGGVSVAKARCGGRYSVRGGKGVFRREMVRGEDIDDQRDGENKEVSYEARPPPPSLIRLPPRGYSTTDGSFYLPRPDDVGDNKDTPVSDPIDVSEEITGGGDEIVSVWSAPDNGSDADGAGGPGDGIGTSGGGGTPSCPRVSGTGSGGEPAGRVARNLGGGGGSGIEGGNSVTSGGLPSVGGGASASAGLVWLPSFKRKTIAADQAAEARKRHNHGAGPSTTFRQRSPRLPCYSSYPTSAGGSTSSSTTTSSNAEAGIPNRGGRAFPVLRDVLGGREVDTSILPVPRSADASGKTVGASPALSSTEKKRRQQDEENEQEEDEKEDEERPAKKWKGQQRHPAFTPSLHSNHNDFTRPQLSPPTFRMPDGGSGGRSGSGIFGVFDVREQKGSLPKETEEVFTGGNDGESNLTNGEANSSGSEGGGGGEGANTGSRDDGGRLEVESGWNSLGGPYVLVGRLAGESAGRNTVSVSGRT